MVGIVALALGGCGPGPQTPAVDVGCVFGREPVGTCGTNGLSVHCQNRDYCAPRPTLLSGPAPYMPPEGRARGVRGSVIATCTITELGSVEDCKIVQSLPYADAGVIETLQAQAYSPVWLGDTAVPVRYTFKVHFR